FHLYTRLYSLSFFFFNDPAPTEIYTLSLHDALPISALLCWAVSTEVLESTVGITHDGAAIKSLITADDLNYATPKTRILVLGGSDRKSTRLNSSHVAISYAVFCLKKKKKKKKTKTTE